MAHSPDVDPAKNNRADVSFSRVGISSCNVGVSRRRWSACWVRTRQLWNMRNIALARVVVKHQASMKVIGRLQNCAGRACVPAWVPRS